MSAKNRIPLLVILALFVSSCSPLWVTIETGTYKGTKYQLQERSSSGMFSVSNSLDWRIKLGDLPALPINANTTEWGPPYSTDIYGADAYLFISDKDTVYKNQLPAPEALKTFYSMLYVSPAAIDEGAFEEYYTFMKDAWPGIDSSNTQDDPRSLPHIIGLVYGNRDKYIMKFKGMHNGKPMVLIIENDGRINLVNDDKWQQENYSGLSQKVQMPGKKILLNPHPQDGGLTMGELKSFRNEQQLPVDKFFSIVPDR